MDLEQPAFLAASVRGMPERSRDSMGFILAAYHEYATGALPIELHPKKWWAVQDLNLGPSAYQADALTLLS